MGIFRKKHPAVCAQVPSAPGMNRWYTSPGSENWFLDEANGIRTLVVDQRGMIRNFPGIVREDFWVQETDRLDLQPRVRYASCFEQWNDKIIFLWQVHPDGRYWADDDGFGWEDDLEVTLYSFLNERGQFASPFRIYGLGPRRFLTKEAGVDSGEK